MNKIKFLIFSLLFLLFFSFALAPLEGPTFLMGFAATDTEIQYPPVPGAPTPTATTTFPAYVKYLFNFSMIIAGLIVLAVLIWAGILYLTSAGNTSQISEAKTKATGAFLGLIILLCSYLILTSINPQLAGITLQPVEPVGGVYLIDNTGKKFYIGDTRQRSLGTGAAVITQIEFISPTSSLSAIYVYTLEDLKGVEQMATNSGGTVVLAPAQQVKSIFFLWDRPGVYLCPVATAPSTFICPTRPIHTVNSIPDLSDPRINYGINFDNTTKSIQVKGIFAVIAYGAIIFEKPGYISDNKCPYVGLPSLPDLDFPIATNNNPPIGQNTLSSLIVFYNKFGAVGTGTVAFYDEINCKGNTFEVNFSVGLISPWRSFNIYPHPAGDWDKRVRSFRIGGPGGVLLMTELAGGALTGVCEFFTREHRLADEKGCVGDLTPSVVYDPNPPGIKPRSYIIVGLSY